MPTRNTLYLIGAAVLAYVAFKVYQEKESDPQKTWETAFSDAIGKLLGTPKAEAAALNLGVIPPTEVSRVA